MSFANSSSDFLRFRQNPRCPGPTGPGGAGGPTGPIGPQGPAGSNGVSVGQNYFFNLAGNIITSTGPTGGNLDVYSYNAGANTAYTGSNYSGYFIQQSATAATGSYVNVARFTSVAGLQSPIPAGVWTFYNNIYSFTGPTGTIGTWAIPTPPGTTNEVYAVVSYVDGATGGQIFETSPKNIDLSDDLVILNGYVQSPITLNNPTGAYFYVDYLATNPNSKNVIELWTQGNSVAYVTTTFSPQQGSQGNTGSTGPQGPQGLPGPAVTTPGTAKRLAFFEATNTVKSAEWLRYDDTTDVLDIIEPTTLNMNVSTILNIDGTVSRQDTSLPIYFTNPSGASFSGLVTVDRLRIFIRAGTLASPFNPSYLTNINLPAGTTCGIVGVSAGGSGGTIFNTTGCLADSVIIATPVGNGVVATSINVNNIQAGVFSMVARNNAGNAVNSLVSFMII